MLFRSDGRRHGRAQPEALTLDAVEVLGADPDPEAGGVGRGLDALDEHVVERERQDARDLPAEAEVADVAAFVPRTVTATRFLAVIGTELTAELAPDGLQAFL